VPSADRSGTAIVARRVTHQAIYCVAPVEGYGATNLAGSLLSAARA